MRMIFNSPIIFISGVLNYYLKQIPGFLFTTVYCSYKISNHVIRIGYHDWFILNSRRESAVSRLTEIVCVNR